MIFYLLIRSAVSYRFALAHSYFHGRHLSRDEMLNVTMDESQAEDGRECRESRRSKHSGENTDHVDVAYPSRRREEAGQRKIYTQDKEPQNTCSLATLVISDRDKQDDEEWHTHGVDGQEESGAAGGNRGGRLRRPKKRASAVGKNTAGKSR